MEARTVPQEAVWKMARRLAELCNGGKWEEDYTPRQMLLWDERARLILTGQSPPPATPPRPSQD